MSLAIYGDFTRTTFLAAIWEGIKKINRKIPLLCQHINAWNKNNPGKLSFTVLYTIRAEGVR